MTPAEKPEPGRKGRSQGTRFVPVTYAATLTEAEFLKTFLEGEDIPALVESEHSEVGGIPSLTRGIPILVPDNRLEEAAAIIASHQRSRSSAEQDADEDADDYDEDEDEDFDDEEEDDEDLDEEEDLLDDEEEEVEDEEA